MGKVVKSVLKIAAVAAVAVFAPPLAGAVAGAVGAGGIMASTLGATLATAGMGAAMGAVLPGISAKEGLIAGGLSGSGLFGPKPSVPTSATGASTLTGMQTSQLVAGAAQGATSSPLAGLGLTGTEAARLAATGVQSAPTSLGAKLSSVASGALGGLRQVPGGLSKALPGLNMIAPQLLASALVSTPESLSNMTKAQQAEFERAQAMNAAVTQQRIDEANKLINEANYYDPNYMGRQAAEAAMIRGGIQATEGTRGLTGERLAAERRRYKLGTSRTAGTAYQQGFGTGVGARLQARQAGIQSLPTEYPTTSATGVQSADEYARAVRRDELAGLSALFSQALGQNQTTSLGA